MTTVDFKATSVVRSVSAQDIAEYRGAVRSRLDTPAGSAKASPIHAFVLAHRALETIVGEVEGSPIHLGQDIRMQRLVRPDEQVTIELDVLGARREARGVRLNLKSVLVGGDGIPFASLSTAVLLVGATGPESFGDISSPAGPSMASKGEAVTSTRTVTVESIQRYAVASGDENPVHLDPAAAQAAGFPGIIAHGMNVMALACEEIVDRFAGGDPGRLRAIGGRFASPVQPDEEIEISLFPDETGTIVHFSCRTAAGQAVKSGWAEIAPEPAPASAVEATGAGKVEFEIAAAAAISEPAAEVADFAEAIRKQAAERPEASALVWKNTQISYGELVASAEEARVRIGRLDLGIGEPIGILGPKSPEAIALVLGALLEGRPFLLPSPALAEQTLTQLFQQAGCRYVLTPDGETRTVPVDEAARAEARSISKAEQVCFMLTTSGSTGLPKIAPLRRPAIGLFGQWAAETFDIRPGTTVLNYAPLNFDLCLLDVWATLAHGGRVVLVDPDQAVNARYLLDLLVTHRVQVVQAVPMFFTLVLEAADASGTRLSHVEHAMFTGDVMPEKTATELPRLFPTARLYNIYGCTETNDSFYYEVDPTSPIETPVPIGQTLPGVEALVVDDELYVWTPYQIAGYLDRAKTAERFARREDGRVYYRTGDLVRRDEQGQYFLVGRSDFQVKVRGVAINTAEVERVLLEHPEVMEAAVVARPDPVAGKLLVSVVRRTPQSRLNSLNLRGHCARRLPQAAIPSTLRIVDDPLPKTSTGKVDRQAIAG